MPVMIDDRRELTRLLGDQVLLRMDGKPDKVGRIVIPQHELKESKPLEDSAYSRATVLARGPGRRGKWGDFIPMLPSIRPGARVLFYFNANSPSMRLGTDLLVVHETSIQAVLED